MCAQHYNREYRRIKGPRSPNRHTVMREGTAKWRVLKAVNDGYWTSREVARYLKMSIRIASAHLSALASMGKIVWHGRRTPKRKGEYNPCKVYEPA